MRCITNNQESILGKIKAKKLSIIGESNPPFH